MNSEILEGKWTQLKGSVQKQWGKLTDDDLDKVNGSAKVRAGKIQERYVKSLDEAEKEVSEWQSKAS